MRARLLLIALAAFAIYASWERWRLRPLTVPPGVLAPDAPQQEQPSADELRSAAAPPPQLGDVRIHPVAPYRISARLLSREPYWWGRAGRLSPLDFAVGWGPMSDSAVLQLLQISQSGRYFWLRWERPPLPPEQLMRHAANMHLVPRDRRVRAALDTMRPGQLIRLRGWLIDASSDDGWSWNTSRTRDDSGDGSCELMWVDDATAIAR